MKKGFSLAVLVLALLAAPLFADPYVIDPAHSEAGFRIRHMMVSKVSGKFKKFSGDFDYDEKNPKAWKAQAAIDAASIDTGVDKRDEHLKSADFFDVQKYPMITFKSTEVKDLGGGKAKLTGLLNMHGVEKPVTLDLEVGGVVPDGKGGTRAGFEATGKINRKDFGISWDKMPGALGDEVGILIAIEGVSEKPAGGAPAEKKMEQQNKMEKEPVKK